MENPHLLPPQATPGEVITFHSHQGGAGRSMAVANTAMLLAGRAHATSPVLMVDWDLEAPGLHQYFPPMADGPGLLELFTACRDQLQRRGRRAAAQDDAEQARAVLDTVGWQRYVVRADQGRPLYLMRAGRFDAGYAERVAALDWEALFHQCPALFRCFAEMLARQFRHVLVDARSGRSDSSGICTTLLPTRLVLLFEANRRSLEGLQALVQRATTYRRSHEDEQRPLLIYPLPTRTDMDCSAQRALCRRGDPATGLPGYQPLFEQVLGEAYGIARPSLESYFDEVQLPQSRSLARGERLAVRGEPVADRFSATRSYEALLGWLAGGHPPWQSRREIPLLAAVAQSRRAVEAGGAYSMMLARDLFRLGLLYADEGRSAAAVLALRESVELHVKVVGEEHLETAAAKALLARALLQEDELDQARILLRCVVETRTRLLGGEHPDVLEACSAQAVALARQGYAEAALDRQEEVLQIQMRLLGPEHLLTLASLAARAAIHYQCGELELARQAQEQVLAVRARLLGAEHEETLRVGAALAQTLARMDEAASPQLHYGLAAQQLVQPFGQSPLHAPLQASVQRSTPRPALASGHAGSAPAGGAAGVTLRGPGVEQVPACYEEPYPLQRAEAVREQVLPEDTPAPRA
ncbi:tetratricopeptide repeat protein [Pseudoduganella aquatica]|uniref:Tetratricopeptide repeat protein n=1 Tax=Pseudoduganella aquatica TaxID=2660641 RepID=A0A7X4HBL7_9BURK|nr:tetratricopeptide repeat protein [Pseudoduganella aquatica]MYN07552.1 tetratricopeptide repeat protein [Pseudoduganella aquatica]